MKIIYHTDKGCRKGCHPVTYKVDEGKKTEREIHICSIDEPGAWWEDKWNCHVDGTDKAFSSRWTAIIWGLTVYGILDFETEEQDKEREEKMNALVEKCVEQFELKGE